MKHIKKKTIEDLTFTADDMNKIPAEWNLDVLKGKTYKELKNLHTFLFSEVGNEGGRMTRAFFFNNEGVICTIPLANPILLYFNEAYNSYKKINKYKEELLQLFTPNVMLSEKSLELFYDLFGATSSFIVLLYSSIEAFVNSKIPENYNYTNDEGNKYSKVYNNMQIQRWLSLEDKINNILNQIEKKNFGKDYPLKQTHIVNLREFRDSIVHTKKIDIYGEYQKLFTTSLKFKYDETLEAVYDFINYYEKNLLEPCSCENDY